MTTKTEKLLLCSAETPSAAWASSPVVRISCDVNGLGFVVRCERVFNFDRATLRTNKLHAVPKSAIRVAATRATNI